MRINHKDIKFAQYELIILGVFLCSGSPRDKAEVLFDLVDRHCFEEIKKTALLSLLEDIFNVIVVKAFLLCSGKHEENVNHN